MVPPVQKRQALGKGLGALIPPRAAAPTPIPAETVGSNDSALQSELTMSLGAPLAAVTVNGIDESRRGVLRVPIEDVHPNRFQPRKTFDEATLAELAESIREHGLIQPILVRKRGQGFEIIAGERRWRACQRAAVQTIEVIVKDLADADVFEWALIENIQREDLNPIEEAEAYRRLLEIGSLTQEQLAVKVSKDRSTIANALRLLKLPDEVRRQVIAGAISMGHARALLALESPDAMVKMARDVLKRGLSVREVERAVKVARQEPAEGEPDAPAPDPYDELPGGAVAVHRVTEDLIQRLSTKVRIVPQGKRGRIEIDYSSPAELERLISVIRD